MQIRLLSASSYSLLTFSFHVIHEILRIARYLCSARRITHVGLSVLCAPESEKQNREIPESKHISTLTPGLFIHSLSRRRKTSLSLALLFPVALCPQITISLALLTTRIIAFFILLVQEIYKLRYNAAPVELVAPRTFRNSCMFLSYVYVIDASRSKQRQTVSGKKVGDQADRASVFYTNLKVYCNYMNTKCKRWRYFEIK